MRKGGSADKGAGFERDICRALSIWITQGARSDVFERNVQSGGRFTSSVKRALAQRGQPGDIMAAHEDGFPFTRRFMVECKHLKTLDFDAYIYDRSTKSDLGKILTFAAKQASEAETPLVPLVIARQNMRHIALFTPYSVYEAAARTTRFGGEVWHHSFHHKQWVMMHFEEVMANVLPNKFLKLF